MVVEFREKNLPLINSSQNKLLNTKDTNRRTRVLENALLSELLPTQMSERNKLQ